MPGTSRIVDAPRIKEAVVCKRTPSLLCRTYTHPLHAPSTADLDEPAKMSSISLYITTSNGHLVVAGSRLLAQVIVTLTVRMLNAKPLQAHT